MENAPVIERAALSATERYSELAALKFAPLLHFPVAEGVVLLSVRWFVPFESLRVTAPEPSEASSRVQYATSDVGRVLCVETSAISESYGEYLKPPRVVIAIISLS